MGVSLKPNSPNNDCNALYLSEAHARIHDTNGGDIMVKKGSNIELNCTVESGDRVHHSLAVFWYLDDTVIDWMGQTGVGDGVQVVPFFFGFFFIDHE